MFTWGFCRIWMVEWMMCQLKLGRHRAEEHIFVKGELFCRRNPSDICLNWMKTFSWHRVRCTRVQVRDLFSVDKEWYDTKIYAWSHRYIVDIPQLQNIAVSTDGIFHSAFSTKQICPRDITQKLNTFWHCNGVFFWFSHWLAILLTWNFLGQNSNLFIV